MTDMKVVSGKDAEGLLRCVFDGEQGRRAFSDRVSKCGANTRLVFGDVDFHSLRNEFEDGILRFEGLSFQDCLVDFSGADFGDGGVSFSGCQCRKPVSFSGAKFGNGDVNFSDTGWTTIDFSGALFSGDGSLDFRGASVNGENIWIFEELGRKALFFSESEGRTFSAVGQKFFVVVKNHHGESVSFHGAMLRSLVSGVDLQGSQNLKQLTLTDSVWAGRTGVLQNIAFAEGGSLQFCRANLAKLQDFSISKVKMARGIVSFETTVFPETGFTWLRFEQFGEGKLNFQNTTFGGPFTLSQESDINWDCDLSFRGATFHGPVDISNLSITTIPNFIATQFTKHLSLEGIQYHYDRAKRLISCDPDDKNAGKLQRLKELAENNRDHRLALQCHADEMRARRWQLRNMGSKAADVLDATYDLISSYGQSVARPFIALVLTWFVFAGLYGEASTVKDTPAFLDVLGYSMAMSVPFLPASSTFRASEFLSLFGDPASVDMSSIYGLMAGQGLVSFVLLFLIGLGLRNRFRI